MILIFATNYVHAVRWCLRQDPPINPKDRNVKILTPSNPHATRARRLTREDRVVVIQHGILELSLADRRRWSDLMDALRGIEYSSPEWNHDQVELI